MTQTVLLPEPTVREETARGDLAAVRLIAPQMERPLGIVHRQRKVFTPTSTKFVELLQEEQDGTETEDE